MKSLQLDIITPDEKVYSGPVTGVQVPGSSGSFEVLYNHAPIISTLSSGKIRIKTESEGDKTFKMQDGVIEVLDNKVIILVEKLLNQ